jgi:hypothetical protein
MRLQDLTKYTFLILLAILAENVNSQELNCNVQISAQKIQGSNREVFESMQKDIYEFMNNTVWTNHVFNYAESIDNNFQFRYVEFQPLEFDPNTYRSNLVSVLGYYAYLILGFDYDSFSPLGGTEFFQVAEKIVTNAQNASEPGWKPYDGSRNKNRYWLIKNLLDKQYEGVRRFIYEYDINGLDRMESRTAEARTNIAESLKLLQEVYRRKPDPFMYLIQIIMESKSDELVNIFSGAFPEEKGRVVEILTEIDSGNKTKYQKITSAS